MLISNKGTLVRTPAEGVSIIGRNTQGVTIIRTAEDEKVVGLQRIEEIQTEELLDEEGNVIPVSDVIDAEATDAESTDDVEATDAESTDDVEATDADALMAPVLFYGINFIKIGK